MTVDELKTAATEILNSDILEMSIYVVVNKDKILLLDIHCDDLKSLTIDFKNSLIGYLVNQEYELHDYSTAESRTGYFVYDVDEKLDTFTLMERALNDHIEEKFSLKDYAVTDIKGIIAILSNETQQIITYKYFTQIEIIGGQKQYIFGIKDSTRIVHHKDAMIRLTPKFDVIHISDRFVILRLEILEKMENLQQIFINESNKLAEDLDRISLVANMNELKSLIGKDIKLTKKFVKACKKSKVLYNAIPTNEIIQFIKDKKSKIGKITFTEDGKQVNIMNKSEAERFLKVLDDDLLTSGLTQLDYWSSSKVESIDVKNKD